MTFQIEAALAGIHPRSEETVRASRDFDRGRATENQLKEVFQIDSQALVSLETTVGLTKVSDGQLKWQDFIRPFSESLIGLKSGADLSRWFDTNTFYKKPTVISELGVPDSESFLLDRYSCWDGTESDGGQFRNKKISLPGPYTFATLVEDDYYESKTGLIAAFAKVLSLVIAGLSKNGISCVQLNEPSLVYRYGKSTSTREDERAAFIRAFSNYFSSPPVEIWLHTYFGDSSRILGDLLSLSGISAIGVDFTQTSIDHIDSYRFKDKVLGCGCVDSRNSLVESPEWVANFSYDAVEALKPKGLIVLPSTDLKYLPRSFADEKLRTIGKAVELLRSKF